MEKIVTRMGDGTLTEMSETELKEDFEAGTQDAAERGEVSALAEDELKHLFDIFTAPGKFASVELGNEVILSFDGGTIKTRRLGVATGRIQAIQFFERALGADTMELAHIDYSYKQIKPITGDEQPVLEQALLVSTVPLFYGAMPNLGIYSQPDGPVPNPAELLPQGKIKEARAAHEEAVEHAVKDMVYVAGKMYESGADGINFDTTGAAGDPDFLATLRATKILKERYPDMCIELGMAGEFILGMHGEMTYDGVRLAGLYPHEQVKLAQDSGVTIFGPVVNTNTSQSCAWNLARTLTFLKPCVENATIPIHVNVGMGVGSVPVVDNPPTDVVSKASKALVEILRLDGLQVGVGDPLGMAVTHAIAAGMGGMRAAGDLVARMQMSRGLRIGDAKAYVAEKLGVSPLELSDPVVMNEVRDDLRLGMVRDLPGMAKGIESKFRIAEVLGIEINCLQRFRERSGLKV